MHARLDRGAVRLLTRTGLDWTHKYPAIASALMSVPARQAYLDGELCGVRPDGTTSFSLIQTASDEGNAKALVFFLFDLLHLDGEAIGARPLNETEGAASRAAVSGAFAASIQRLSDRPRASLLRACMRPEAGRNYFEAGGRALRGRQSRSVAQGQMPEPRGVRGDRLDRSRRRPSMARSFAARLLRSGRAAHLCGPCWHRHRQRGTRKPVAPPATAGDRPLCRSMWLHHARPVSARRWS